MKWWSLAGSTEIDTWHTGWEMIDIFHKSGFETNVSINVSAWVIYRLSAWDKDMGVWINGS